MENVSSVIPCMLTGAAMVPIEDAVSSVEGRECQMPAIVKIDELEQL